MIPIDQESDKDCMRACIASILELGLHEVPDFLAIGGVLWKVEWIKWCYQRGISIVEMEYVKNAVPQCYCIAVGSNGDKNYSHAVVMFGNNIVHDPADIGMNKGNPMRKGIKVETIFLLTPTDIGRFDWS